MHFCPSVPHCHLTIVWPLSARMSHVTAPQAALRSSGEPHSCFTDERAPPMRRVLPLLLVLLSLASTAFAQKKALFDNFHAETAGNADWTIDDNQPTPSPAQSAIVPSTPRTYWTGAISSWGVDLVKRGFTVTINNAAITYGNAGNSLDLANFDVFIVPEPNTVFTAAEATAIKNFVRDGGGLVCIGDHHISDRNNDGFDSPMIWNALDPTFELGVHWGTAGDANNNLVQTSSNVRAVASDSVTRGPVGNVVSLAFHNGTTFTIHPEVNPTVRGEVWMTGVAQTSNTGIMAASSQYGSGRVFFCGDSSPIDDGSAQAGNTNIFDGWSEVGDSLLFMNATLWAARRTAGGGGGGDVTAPTVTLSSPVGGEAWKAGSLHAITWTASDNVGVTAVDLAYSTDGGATYPNSIATNLANSGSFSWTVPNVVSSTVRVRATARDAAGNSASSASGANFTVNQWVITASAGAGGSITPSGAVGVAQGANQAFTIAATGGGSITGVTVDGVAQGAISSFTFTNVTADHTISATFSAPTTGPWIMANGNYLEQFGDIASWANNFTSPSTATRFASVATGGSGTIPNATRITTATSTFQTGTTGGVQKGTGNIQLLTTGSTDNTSSAAIDLRLDFSHTNAGTLSFDWASVNNSTGDRKGSLRVYTSPNGTTWTELTAAAVLNFTNNAPTSGSRTAIALPAGLSNSATARIRFYYHNGSGGTTGSRPKISLDNIAVTGTPSGLSMTPGVETDEPAATGLALALGQPKPNPSAGEAMLEFTLPQSGSARLEVLDLSGRRVWTSEATFAPGKHSLRWSGRTTGGANVPAGVYFVRLVTPFGVRTGRLARL